MKRPAHAERLASLARFARFLLVVAATLAFAPHAYAAVRTYVIAIGNNEPPPGSAENLRTLQFADDDAADFFSFTRGFAVDASLLTVLDVDSQERFPGLAAVARPPTLAELRRTVAAYRDRIAADQSRGDEAVLLFFFSGHGSRDPGKPAALAMLDGPLTQGILYDEILATLPARFIHLLVDACHAEAVVRPRDLSAETVEVSDADVRELAARSTLDRFPNVGAIVAAASAAQAHEWDFYQRGVFTHEMLSGLRGAADVNGDGRVEYSELSAFIAAANRDITDARAHPEIVVRAPALDRRAPIVDLSHAGANAILVGSAASLGHFWVEDAHGNRLVDAHAERGFRIGIMLPAEQTLFLRAADGETELHLRGGSRVAIEGLALNTPSTRARGALDVALQRGSFATAFGPSYYRGYVDSHGSDFVSVPTDPGGGAKDGVWVDRPARPVSRTAGVLITSIGAAAAVTSAVFAGLAVDARNDVNSAQYERPATDALNRFTTDRSVAIGFGAAAVVGIAVGTVMLLRR